MKSDAKSIPDIWYLRLTNDTLYCILSQRMPHLFNNIFVFLLLKVPHCYHNFSNTVNSYQIKIGRNIPWYLIQMSPKR